MMDVYDEYAILLGRFEIDIQDYTHRSIYLPIRVAGGFGQLELEVATMIDGNTQWQALRVHREHLELLKQCRSFYPVGLTEVPR